MSNPPYKILILCTGNTARSIMGEYLAKVVAPGRFESYSAGADPKDEINPMTVRVLKEVHGIDVTGARPKSWDEFADVDFDFVITVCGNAKESCPVWPGKTILAHWGSEDPAAAEGTDAERFEVFKRVSFEIRRRIEKLSELPIEELDRDELQELVNQIGRES